MIAEDEVSDATEPAFSGFNCCFDEIDAIGRAWNSWRKRRAILMIRSSSKKHHDPVSI